MKSLKSTDTYRLCYVDSNVLYFTDNFEHCWGDDWNDAPYDCNAGEPYTYCDDWSPEENLEHHHTHIRYIAFKSNGSYIKQPCDIEYNSSYSVEDINKGAIAWLYSQEVGGLRGGATISEAKDWLKKNELLYGELK